MNYKITRPISKSIKPVDLLVLCLIFGMFLVVLVQPLLRSADLLDRSVTLSNSQPSADVSHTFAFNLQSNSNVGSIAFEYCSNDPFFINPCTVPAGIDVSGATLTSEVGETGFAIDAATTINRLVISRLPSVTSPGVLQYAFSDIINPSTVNQSVYVRISLHSTTDGTGPRTDEGAVVFRIVSSIDTRAYVPPHLTFCIGITVALNCNSASGFYIDMGELSKTQANTGTSQFSTATNDFTGYSVQIFGTTMTSGNKIIPALTTPKPSSPGNSQFGINLRDNSSPNVGENPTGSGAATPNPNYSLSNNFKFTSGDTLTSVGTASDFNRYTISYLVNVSTNQAPGIYNATFTYVATASF